MGRCAGKSSLYLGEGEIKTTKLWCMLESAEKGGERILLKERKRRRRGDLRVERAEYRRDIAFAHLRLRKRGGGRERGRNRIVAKGTLFS